MKKEARVEDGINLEVNGTALAEELGKRIGSHEREASDLAEELELIRARTVEGLPSAEVMRLDLRRRDAMRMMNSHHERARFLDFVRQHLKPTTTYRLTLRELEQFGITPRAWC